MSVIINKNTTQTPVAIVGNAGTQVIRFIPACRVYLKTSDSTTAAPVQNYYTKSNGTTPAGWTDLGIMNGPGQVLYVKTKKEIQTGIDKVVRAVYIAQKTANIDFSLDQYDDLALAQVSGLAPSIVTAQSIVNYQLGQEDVVQKAILLVAQNKLDGKEIQFYHPNAYISFQTEYNGDEMRLKVNAELVAFTSVGATVDSLISTTIFA